MGSFCDVVVAPVRDARKVATANGSLEKWKSCSFKGLTGVDFAVLHKIVTAKRAPDFEFVHTAEGVMVQRIPDETVNALAALQPSQLARVAKRWSRSDELKGTEAQ